MRLKHLAMLLLLGSVACQVRKPGVDTPVPLETAQLELPKSFFINGISSDGDVTIKDLAQSKTFQCGWAPEKEVGWISERTSIHNLNEASACNVEFEITEKVLIGRRVSLMFPNDRSRWPIIITIPITQHYYLEKQKDPRGREVNQVVRNSQRSQPLRRPRMVLDLSGLKLTGWGSRLLYDAAVSQLIDEVEVDQKAGFLGFSTEYTGANTGSANQARIRFNFLEFKSDSKMKKAYHPPENSEILNPVFILGEKAQGLYDAYYMMRWDFGPDKQKKYTIYLNNFPDNESVRWAQEMLQGWNQTLTKVLLNRKSPVHPYFTAQRRQSGHAFDLRYPSINWVADKRVSAFSPLGVAFVNPDVRTGKVLWGGFNIYAGGIDRFINYYAQGPSSSQSAQSEALKVPGEMPGYAQLSQNRNINFSTLSGLSGLTRFLQNTVGLNILKDKNVENIDVNNIFSQLKQLESSGSVDSALVEQWKTKANELQQKAKSLPTADAQAFVKALQQEMNQKSAQTIAENIASNAALAADEAEQIFNANSNQGVAPNWFLSAPIVDGSDDENLKLPANFKNLPLLERIKIINSKNSTNSDSESYKDLGYQPIGVYDLEHTFDEVSDRWREGILANPGRNRKDVFRSVVKNIMSHEFGHVLGLGHNFKGNILPEEKLTPVGIYKNLKADAKTLVQKTTVMDYNDGLVEVNLNDQQTLPGPYDEQVLQYIYNQSFPSSINKDGYVYSKLGPSLKIPRNEKQSGEYVSINNYYLPACNDIEASYGADPYCNRWDSGYDAITIVNQHFSSYYSKLISSVMALTASSMDKFQAEFELWRRSFYIFSRVRKFYDYMRLEYDFVLNDLYKKPTDLNNFAGECTKTTPSDTAVGKMLVQYPELRNLCLANIEALRKFTGVLSLKGRENADIDLKKRFSLWSEGDASPVFGNWLGTWKELSLLPVKQSAILALTAAYPIDFTNGWLMPTLQYLNDRARFLYMSFFPNEVLAALAANVRNNMKVSFLDDTEKSFIGSSVLMMGGSLLNGFTQSNEGNRLNFTYNENLQKQSRMETMPHMVVVYMEKESNQSGKGDPNRVYSFKSTIYDLRLQGSSGARNVETKVDTYILRDGKVFITPPRNTLLYQMTDVFWVNNTTAYFFAIRMLAPEDPIGNFEYLGVSNALTDIQTEIVKRCVEGEVDKGASAENGLKFYFAINNTDFRGFDVRDNIMDNPNPFITSIGEEHDRYLNYFQKLGRPVDPKICDEAYKAVRMVFLAGAALNGYWLPELITTHYIKGF